MFLLALLSLAVLGGVFLAVSISTALFWPVLRPVFEHLTPRAESRTLLAIALAPSFVGVVVLFVCFLPSFGASTDHCLEHGSHHPHLCWNHLPTALPGVSTLLLAGLAVFALLRAGIRVFRGTWMSFQTGRFLEQLSQSRTSGMQVLPSPNPQAFVIGIARPKLFVSRGLLAMSPRLRRTVLSHERAHLQRRDPLRRLVANAALACHLPVLSAAIRDRLSASTEEAADAFAAKALGDGAKVAEALVDMARLQQSYPAHGLGFVGGNLERRVRRLLEPRGRDLVGPIVPAVGALAAIELAILLVDPLHHGIETLLGFLA